MPAEPRPFRYKPCEGNGPHRRLYMDANVTVWICPTERKVWTDPPNSRGFRITFSMDRLPGEGPTFEWL